MKLKLRSAGDVQVLTILEMDSPDNIHVVRAGITKILKAGKNRIIIELSDARALGPEMICELSQLKSLSNELSGDIVLSGVDEKARIEFEKVCTPPFVSCYPTTDLAIEYFKQKRTQEQGPQLPPLKAAEPASPPAAEPAAAAPGAAKPASASAPAPAADKTPQKDPAEVLREEIKQREQGEMGALRKENEHLRAELASLSELMATKVLDRREPPDIQSFREKIRILEAQLTEVMEKPPAQAGK